MEVDLMLEQEKLAKEREEMNLLDARFEEKTGKLAHIIHIKQDEVGEEGVGMKDSIEGVEQKGQKKAAVYKRDFVVAHKSSARVIDKTTRVLEKAHGRLEAATGGNSLYILNSFPSQHFMNVASCGIDLGSSEDKELEVISTVLAKERVQALLAETRARL
jgi:hypothetical protein